MMSPVVEAMARDYSGRALFGKLNTDQNSVTSTKFRVMNIPNFMVFKNGRLVDQVLGAVGRGGLDALLGRHLA